MITHRFSSNVLHTDVAAACVDQCFSSLFQCAHISNLTILQDMSALLPSSRITPLVFGGMLFCPTFDRSDRRARAECVSEGGRGSQVVPCSYMSAKVGLSSSQRWLSNAPGKLQTASGEGFLKHVTPSIVKKVVMNVALHA